MTLFADLKALRDAWVNHSNPLVRACGRHVTNLIDKAEADTCKWVWDGNEASDTACGFVYGGRIVINRDGAKQPVPTFCPYCGKPIEEVSDERINR